MRTTGSSGKLFSSYPVTMKVQPVWQTGKQILNEFHQTLSGKHFLANVSFFFHCDVVRVLSDWLEAKLGGEQQSEEHLDGSLWTLSVTNALQESGKLTHKVQIAVKVRSHSVLHSETKIQYISKKS